MDKMNSHPAILFLEQLNDFANIQNSLMGPCV